MTINAMKSIERTLDRKYTERGYLDTASNLNKEAFQLGYCESAFAAFIHLAIMELGEDNVEQMMSRVGINVVHNG